MYKKTFDGSHRALDLMSRIGTEDRIGESLAPDTINLYGIKIRHVAARHLDGQTSELSPEILVRDLTERIEGGEITRATARVEKSAALFWLAEQAQNLLDSGSSEIGRYESAYKDILSLGTKHLPKNSFSTSGKKMRAFPDEALEMLWQANLSSKSNTLHQTFLFVSANLMVGLRPVEWLEAELFDYQHHTALGQPQKNKDGSVKTSLALRVKNAKRSSIRGNGDERIILLDGMNQRQIGHLRQWMGVISQLRSEELLQLSEAEINRKIYKNMQRALRKVLVAHDWGDGEMPTLYSTRHQAVANARADGMTQHEIAALFGHSSTHTARRHYGKSYAGYSDRSMRAAPESIMAVRSNIHTPSPSALSEVEVRTEHQRSPE